MMSTGSNVAYSLGVVSRYQFDPEENHWKVMKIILKYLRNTKDQWLIYGDTDLKLVKYTNFNFQSNHDDNKNVSGYVFTMNKGVICWKNFMQHMVADLICEAKYVATSMLQRRLFG